MNMFDPLDASTLEPRPKWPIPAAGLLAATVVACLGSRLLPRHMLSWTELITSAAQRVLLVLLAGAATMWGIALTRQDKSGALSNRLIVRTSLQAVWLAPLALLISENSAWAMVVAAVLVASVTGSFCSLEDQPGRTNADEPPVLFLSGNAFGSQDLSQWHRHLFSSVSAALCVEMGAIAESTRYPFMAAILVGAASALWTWSFIARAHPPDRKPRTSRRSFSRATLAIALAIILTSAGLLRYAAHADRFGGLGFLASENSHHGSPTQEKDEEPRRRQTPKGSAPDPDDAYSGVVLWPKKQTYAALVAPAPLLLNSSSLSSRSANPLVIPFDGVYWFFRAPDVRPPKGSHEAHGSPELFGAHSNDQRALSMEAHQNLGTLIDLDCCSRIQITIRNADRYPETVRVELILMNNSLPGKPSQSLGSTMVRSTLHWRLYDDRPPVPETLSFEIPRNPTIRRFDELAIVFHLDPNRAEFGAKIGIDRFVLVPRGL